MKIKIKNCGNYEVAWVTILKNSPKKWFLRIIFENYFMIFYRIKIYLKT